MQVMLNTNLNRTTSPSFKGKAVFSGGALRIMQRAFLTNDVCTPDVVRRAINAGKPIQAKEVARDFSKAFAEATAEVNLDVYFVPNPFYEKGLSIEIAKSDSPAIRLRKHHLRRHITPEILLPITKIGEEASFIEAIKSVIQLAACIMNGFKQQDLARFNINGKPFSVLLQKWGLPIL